MVTKIIGWSMIVVLTGILLWANHAVSKNALAHQLSPCPTSNAPIFQTATAIKQYATAYTPTVDTFTPIPIITTTPAPGFDSYRVNVDSLFIRTAPARSAMAYSGAIRGQIITVDSYTLAGGYWWGHLTGGGYIALREGANNWYVLKQ